MATEAVNLLLSQIETDCRVLDMDYGRRLGLWDERTRELLAQARDLMHEIYIRVNSAAYEADLERVGAA